jgi:hypothetical protein
MSASRSRVAALARRVPGREQVSVAVLAANVRTRDGSQPFAETLAHAKAELIGARGLGVVRNREELRQAGLAS